MGGVDRQFADSPLRAATTGTFTRNGDDFKGLIITLSVQAKNVRIVPEDTNGNDKTPNHCLLAGDIAFGAGWTKTSREGRDYLPIKLDDQSFAAPVYASLMETDPDDGSFALICSR